MGKFSPNVMANYLVARRMHRPASEVIVYGDRRLTWDHLAGRVFKLSQALIQAGVNKGDQVAFMFYNTPEFLEVNYAIQAAGAIPAPMNYRFTGREVEYQGNHCDAKIFLFESRNRSAVEAAAPNLKNITTYICSGGETAIPGAVDYEPFLNSGVDRDPQVANSLDDVAVMVYTGGTTGLSKGVMLTYGSHLDMFATLLARIITRAAEIQLTPEQLARVGDTLPLPGIKQINRLNQKPWFKKLLARPGTYRALYRGVHYLMSHPGIERFSKMPMVKYMTPSMPFFHDASYQILILAAMVGNLCFVLVPSVKFEPDVILEVVQREQPVFMANVPTGWKKIVTFPEFGKYDVSSLRVAATGAGACPVKLKKQIFERFPGIIIMDLFGQTEMTPVTSFRIDPDPQSLKERSVGKSIVEVKIVDEAGAEVPSGQIGEIMYQSGTIMKGYYKDEAKTQEAMDGGWFRSGDLGYLDEDGEVRLVDRKKECINTGGEKVFPLEVEEVIHEHPKVEEVCIIGIPDEEWGQTIRAVVQLKPGETAAPEEIIEFLRDKLAGFKIPRSVVFVAELPLSAAGKVQRAKIREAYGCAEP